MRTTSAVAMMTWSFSVGCAHPSAAAGPSARPGSAPVEARPAAVTESAAAAAAAAVETKEVRYQAGATQMRGFLAYPQAPGKRPAVLVVHEWWGLNDYARGRARKLAELGYVALALDMYGNGRQASHPDDAQKLSSAVMGNLDEAAQRFEAAKAVLESDPRVDATKIAAIGYCFGGGVVLQMARRGEPLSAVASFHGTLGTQQAMQPGVFSGQILVATGGADHFVPPEQVEAFRQEMAAAGVEAEVVVYPGAKHSFTNPDATAIGQKLGLPLAYDPQADADSWHKLQQLLERVWGAR